MAAPAKAKSTKELESGLYVTATPIGNLGDITYRAVETLKSADLILCEDTRQTAKLCAAYEIKTPRTAYHEHNAARVRSGIIKKLQDGARICLVSDAGTPLISDPGYKLVREAINAGAKVFALPGPSAAIAALSVAGAPSHQFFFAGFPPAKAGARATFFEKLRSIDATLIFYETPSRLGASLEAMANILGNRRAVVARELTKLHEDVTEGRLGELAAQFAANPAKGEIVILTQPEEHLETSAEYLDAFLTSALQEMSVKDAAAAAAKALNVTRNDAYERALALKKDEKP